VLSPKNNVIVAERRGNEDQGITATNKSLRNLY
jgi:hypothetical protein